MYKKLLFLIFLLISGIATAQINIPFREDSSYRFQLDYNFKSKPLPEKDYVSLRHEKSNGSEVLPYVKLNFDLLKLQENDYRIKVVDNHNRSVLNKRLKEPLSFTIDMGFSDDLKERIVPYSYSVFFLDEAKKIQSKITIEVSEEGILMLNEQVYGTL